MPLSNSPVSFRPPRTRRSVSSVSRRDASRQSLSLRLLRQAKDLIEQGEKLFFSLTTLQQAGLIGIGVFLFVAGVLSLVYHEQIFHYMTSFAKGWREIRAGWLILWSMTFLVSFPPLIGYSSCVGLAGFVYGFPNGFVKSVHFARPMLISSKMVRRSYSQYTRRDRSFLSLPLLPT